MLVDMHATTSASDGRPLQEVVARSRDLGLDGVCIVDRDASRDAAYAVVREDFGDYPVFIGVELLTRDGTAILITPSIDPFYTREEWRQLGVLERPSLRTVADLAETEDGVLVVAQPYDRRAPVVAGDRVFALDAAVAVEVATAKSSSAANELAIEAVAYGTKPGVAGSAGGDDDDFTWITMFRERFRTQQGLINALRGGDFWPLQVGSGEAPKAKRRDSGGGSSRSKSGGRGGSGRGRGRKRSSKR